MSWLDTLEEIRKTDWSSASGTERIEKAHEVINISAYAGALVSLVPVPLSDLVLLLPVHTAMVMTVGHVFGRKLTDAEARRVALELGAVAGLTFAGGAAISALRKLLLPAIGGLLSVPATFALTWGLGRVAVEYFQNPSLSRDDLKKIFEDALKEGKSTFSKDAFERFRQRNGAADGEKARGTAEATATRDAAPETVGPGGGTDHPSSPPDTPTSVRPTKKRTL